MRLTLALAGLAALTGLTSAQNAWPTSQTTATTTYFTTRTVLRVVQTQTVTGSHNGTVASTGVPHSTGAASSGVYTTATLHSTGTATGPSTSATHNAAAAAGFVGAEYGLMAVVGVAGLLAL